MIVHQYLLWAKTASQEERGRVLGALAAAYADCRLLADDRLEFEAALPVLAQDPFAPARLALVEALSRDRWLPADLAQMLATLEGAPGLLMLARSPVLNERELIELAETGDETRRAAIAGRVPLSAPVAAALAEIAGEAACLALVSNVAADLPGFALGRIVARHGQDAPLRAALLARRDLPASVHQALIRAVANALSVFVVQRGRRGAEGAEGEAAGGEAGFGLARRSALAAAALASGEATPEKALEWLLAGRMRGFVETVAALSGLPADRVAALAADRSGYAFLTLYDRIGLPPGSYVAFRTALHLLQKEPYLDEQDAAAGLRRRIVEAALEQYARLGEGSANPMVAQLQRWRAEGEGREPPGEEGRPVERQMERQEAGEDRCPSAGKEGGGATLAA